MTAKSRQDKITKKQMFWQTHIKQWSQSGLSQAAYCTINNLKTKSFTYFKARLKKKDLSVELVQIPIEQLHTPSFLKLNIGSGFQIEIPDGFSSSTLEQVLVTLRSL
jgi:hypothetical protein